MKSYVFSIFALILCTGNVFAENDFSKDNATSASSAIYAGGPLYQSAPGSINELKASGFNTIIIWTIHIDEDGNLNLNGEFPIVEDGKYIGHQNYPDFASNIASLKRGKTSINRLEFSLSAGGSETYQNIKSLLECDGSGCKVGSETILYRNFLALKNAFPDIDAVNNDDELEYDLTSAVAFHGMLHEIGLVTAIAPADSYSYWQSFIKALNTKDRMVVNRLYLQLYSFENLDPCDWQMGVPVYPGFSTNDTYPNDLPYTLGGFHKRCPDAIKGAYIWLYDNIQNSDIVSGYSDAIHDVLRAPEY